ncbi:Vps51/Vps67 family protein [Prunus dulcis]|uniref:Vacuolar protein sorting-associated protein 51 homolog n=1 Tax=Prunus dulcis TaxID=3755 RepID=A0A4Y1REN1_PRUDU|nr:Vps51/Vps67 family protein [Prunus dulcis]
MSSPDTSSSSKYATLDAINTTSFDPDQYMHLLVHKSNLEGLLQKHVEMAAEIKNLDTDLQMMKSNIVNMEANMEQLLEKIMSVQCRSDGVNTSLFEKREHIEKLHRTRNLLRKVQFIYDLPARLGKCIKSEAYADAVKFYTGAMPIFKAYGDSSFQDCKRASEEAVTIIIKNLQGKLFSDSESIQARAEAAVLLKQLDFPVDSLKVKLLEKLEQSVAGLQLKIEDIGNASVDSNDNSTDSVPATAHETSVREFAEAIRAYRVIFPDSEMQLTKLAQDLVSSISSKLSRTENALTKAHTRQKDKGEEYSLQVALEGGKKAVLQGSMDVLLDFRQLLDDNLGLLVKLKDLIIDWVQEGFQDFFRALDGQFLLLSGKNSSATQDLGLTEGIQDDKVLAGLVLVLAQEIAASFSGGGARGYEYGPAFVPGEICRIFHSAVYKYENPADISSLKEEVYHPKLGQAQGTPGSSYLEVIRSEVKQILPEGIRRHRRADSTGSTASSRSNPLREEKLSRSNTQRARSQLLETHLAKLFKQKVEIFTKVEFTQESVVTTLVKLCLKSLQEFVRLQTFNRSGFQQIQLDIQFLRTPLKEMAEDEAAVDFLLDEVIVAAAERCLDPIPLEPAILDKLIQAKLAKTKEQNPNTLFNCVRHMFKENGFSQVSLRLRLWDPLDIERHVQVLYLFWLWNITASVNASRLQ